MDESKLFYVNSRNRESGSDSDFTFKIETGTIEYTHVTVLQAYIPKSYYLMQDGKNTFTLTEGASTVTITIPPGNYTRNTLQTNLETLLNAGSPTSWTYIVSVPSRTSAETGKYSFTVSGNGGVQPILTFNTYIYEQLGFAKNSANAFSGDSLESTNVINLQREQTIFIHSDLASNGGDNILQEVFADESDFAGITFQNTEAEAYSKKIATNSSNTYRFYLTDENDTSLNLNGQNIVFTLCLYKKSNALQFLKEYLQYLLQKEYAD